MSGRSNCTVYVGNLEERVTDRVLYDILIQAGRLVDLHIPRDKETDKPKGYAFAEYETEEIAEYAVKLFSGLVTLYNRSLKFAISGKDKFSPSSNTTVTPQSNLSHIPRSYPVLSHYTESSQHGSKLSTSSRSSACPENYLEVPPPPGVTNQSNGYGSHLDGNSYEYSRRVSGATGSISRSMSQRYDTRTPISYPSYEYLH